MKNVRKPIKKIVVAMLLAATTTLTSCDVMLGVLGGMAMGVAAYNPYGYTPSYGSTNYDYLLDPNYAIMQTQQQQAQMNAVNQQLINQSIQQTNQQMEELNRVNQQLIETSIWQAENGINLGGTSGTVETGGSGSNSGTSGNPVQPHKITESCPHCHGSGKCNTCNGTHRFLNGLTGNYLECPNCKPDGRCTHCGGSGKVTKTRYY